MNTDDQKPVVIDEKHESSRFKSLSGKFAAVSAVGTAALIASPAHAAILDVSELNTEMVSIKTAVLGVIAVAVSIGIAIVGWKWAKRALFSV